MFGHVLKFTGLFILICALASAFPAYAGTMALALMAYAVWKMSE